MTRFCAVLVLLFAVAASAQSSRSQADSMALARRVETLLAAPELQKNLWGMQVVSLPEGEVLYQRNAEKLMQPASTTKLFTTAAALTPIGSALTLHDALPTPLPWR